MSLPYFSILPDEHQSVGPSSSAHPQWRILDLATILPPWPPIAESKDTLSLIWLKKMCREQIRAEMSAKMATILAFPKWQSSAPGLLAESNTTNIQNGRGYTSRCLPMMIEGNEIKAQHDTGAEGSNFMPVSLASELRLQIWKERSDCKTFRMANGKKSKSIGRVRVWCSFAKDQGTRMECWFYVFKKLAAPLIMGSEFLAETKTMTEFSHRLEACAPVRGTLPSVNLIGSTQRSQRRLAVLIDKHPTNVNADTGCGSGDLMSPAYRKEHGHKIDRREECRKRFLLADNTVAETIGQVKARLTMGNGDSYDKVFDILPGLTSDVVLGEATLHEINAFKAHESSFLDIPTDEQYLDLGIIIREFNKLNTIFANILSREHRHSRASYQPSSEKRKDDEMMEALYAKDEEAKRLRAEQARTSAPATAVPPESPQDRGNHGQQLDERGNATELHSHAAPLIPQIRAASGQTLQHALGQAEGEADGRRAIGSTNPKGKQPEQRYPERRLASIEEEETGEGDVE